MSLQAYITNTGKAKLAAATAGGDPVQLSQAALGDGNGEAVIAWPGMTALVREVWRGDLSSVSVDEAGTAVMLEIVAPMDTGGYWVREVGVFDADGDMFAVAAFPETYKPAPAEGSGTELDITIPIPVADASTIELTVDPSRVYATQTAVAAAVAEHNEAEDAHPDIRINVAAVAAAITNHADNTDNPHATTAEQVGAAPESHVEDTDNPHEVTPGQIGAALAAYLHVRDEKASGTEGGTFTSGAWYTRDLNTVVKNTITGASLASNQITLPAGNYRIEASAPAVLVNRHKLSLYNVTNSAHLVAGQNARVGVDACTSARLAGDFTLAASAVLELRHRCQTTSSTSGFGQACSFTVNEVYAEVRIWKV